MITKYLIPVLLPGLLLSGCNGNWNKGKTDDTITVSADEMVMIPGYGFVKVSDVEKTFIPENRLETTLLSCSDGWNDNKIGTEVFYQKVYTGRMLYLRVHFKGFDRKSGIKCGRAKNKSEQLFSNFDIFLKWNNEKIRLDKDENIFISKDTGLILTERTTLPPKESMEHVFFQDIYDEDYFTLAIPMTMFHEVPAGKQKIQLEILQRNFKHEKDPELMRVTNETEFREDSVYYLCGCLSDPWISARYEFELDVPLLHRYTITHVDFELKDSLESVWAGFMEMSPKLYFSVNYFGNPAVMSGFWERDLKFSDDTPYTIYQYENERDIIFNVFDFDNLNDDDLLEVFSFDINAAKGVKPSDGNYKHLNTIRIEVRDDGITNRKLKVKS